MQIVQKSVNGLQQFSLEALLANRRIIDIQGEINEQLAIDVMHQMMYHAQEDKNCPIKVIINSPGGSVDAGMLIYDVMQTAGVPLEVYCTGMAYSMAALLFAAGPKGHRFILPHSRVMIHEPLVQYGVGGKTSSIQTLAEDMMRTKEDMIELLSQHTGQPKDKLREITKTDTFFSAQEAVEFGLADQIVDFSALTKN